MDEEQGKQADGISLVCSDVWFDDGTVVLQVEKTLFRVYRGVLAAQSSIFRDTFAIPQPPTQEKYDGCPLILLHDSPEDMRLFLMATHDAGYFANTPVDGIMTLSSLLRLATKYEVEHLRMRMISILTTIYPASLTAWLEREPPAGYVESTEDDFLALRLAGEQHILRILPGIYYECCSYSTTQLLETLHISLADKRKCLAIRDVFEEYWCRRIYDFLFRRPESCAEPSACGGRQLKWLEYYGLPSVAEVLGSDFDWNSWRMCTACVKAAKKSFYERRTAFWEALPTMLKLGTWEELISASVE
ncbi:hypothetical protein B0H14DRAFT_3759338 [Mycena olivaceomarginata]|nr:hypothetical protein B0H14DRAFT_3660634 [Mycena olivaceomarginata]KAJ7881753.1 hypothetical protein B0H14DRAFT_3759338 [Mycena olivaceomarginata]